MRPLKPVRSHICLTCGLRNGRLPFAVRSYARGGSSDKSAALVKTRTIQSSAARIQQDKTVAGGHNPAINSSHVTAPSAGHSQPQQSKILPINLSGQSSLSQDSEPKPKNSDKSEKSEKPEKSEKLEKSDKLDKLDKSEKPEKPEKSDKLDKSDQHPASKSIKLSDIEVAAIDVIRKLEQRIQNGVFHSPQSNDKPSMSDGQTIEKVLQAKKPLINKVPVGVAKSRKIRSAYKVHFPLQIKRQVVKARPERPSTQNDTKEPGIIKGVEEPKTENESQEPATTLGGRRRRPLMRVVRDEEETEAKSTKSATQQKTKTASRSTKQKPNVETQNVAANSLNLQRLDVGDRSIVPRLSFDLSRVLFNPGVYQLRDPRSRVYNFDPYLEQIMPVTEFNFEGLNKYLTSSADKTLLQHAHDQGKKYIGSSSSMSASLSHFHFLLSHWRELSTNNFSRGFEETYKSFTILSKAPAAIFLRWRDGKYAVDADKEFDEPNVLMGLGKALEKLFTLEKQDFEKWRKTHTAADKDFVDQNPESYLYSEQGDFLLRSQLDAYDPRLPGSGLFDLKTRAVVGVRMNVRDHEVGIGYQIKKLFGTWESYEREYYDMMRSTFLKYSIQVRMGNMDGIFVAYHNTERIFGFQYVPLAEIDVALHGQADPCLGNQEFKFSVNFMNEIFDRATKQFPEQSLRIYFETREGSTVSEPQPYLHAFIEPISEEQIQVIQNSQHELFEKYERRVFYGEDTEKDASSSSRLDGATDVDSAQELSRAKDESVGDGQEQETLSSSGSEPSTIEARSDVQPNESSNAADVPVLDKILEKASKQSSTPTPNRQLLALKLTVQNKVNGRSVARPSSLQSDSEWTVDYQLEQLADDAARRLYVFCQNRRQNAMQTALTKNSNNYYLRRIREMSDNGSIWRKNQDEQDAQRETVVLYSEQK